MTTIEVRTRINVYIDNEEELTRLRRENECLEIDNKFMLCLLREIGSAIDHCDQQQISSAIRQLRGQLGTDKLMDGALKPGLVRE